MTALLLVIAAIASGTQAEPEAAVAPPSPAVAETSPAAAPASARPQIPDGTLVLLTLSETLSSKRHVKGDLFRLAISEDLTVNGVVVLPKGTPVVGEITRAETKAAFGVSGKLEARALYAELPDGTLRLSGRIGSRGEGGTTETALAFVAIGTIAFVVTGKSAEIPAGTELVARIGSR